MSTLNSNFQSSRFSFIPGELHVCAVSQGEKTAKKPSMFFSGSIFHPGACDNFAYSRALCC